jgi:hypothetical protein
VSKNPSSAESIKELKRIIGDAKAAHIDVAPAVLKETAKSFADAAKSNPEALGAAADILNFRSDVNALPSSLKPSTPSQWIATPHWHFEGEDAKVKGAGEVYFDDSWVSANQAADISEIGSTLNSAFPRGPAHIIIHGGGVTLDNYLIKGVIFQQTQIHYWGGSVEIQNTQFLGCQFILHGNSSNVDRLISAVAASQLVNFSA